MKNIKKIVLMLIISILTLGCSMSFIACGGDTQPTVTYTVTFIYNMEIGSRTSSSQSVNSGNTVTPPDLHITGYTLEGWFKDETFNKQFDFTTKITSDLTLYAKWEEDYNRTAFIADLANGKGKSEQYTTVTYKNELTKEIGLTATISDGKIQVSEQNITVIMTDIRYKLYLASKNILDETYLKNNSVVAVNLTYTENSKKYDVTIIVDISEDLVREFELTEILETDEENPIIYISECVYS